MTDFGYTMMSEQAGPRQLVADVVAAEKAGFDFSVISDHYFPWFDSQGHSSFAWSVLGAVAQATETIPLMTYVTCPTFRYNPVVIAQAAATVQLLCGGGSRWAWGRARPKRARGRRRMAVGRRSPRDARGGDQDHPRPVDGRLRDTRRRVLRGGLGPDLGPPRRAARDRRGRLRTAVLLAGELGDILVAVEPSSELVEAFDAAGGTGKPRVGQVPVCIDADERAAVARAHDQFRWFAGGFKVNAELPGTAAFAAASQFVRPYDVAQEISCGPDVNRHVDAVRPFVDAGFTHVALVQIGGDHQEGFMRWSEDELLPALRAMET